MDFVVVSVGVIPVRNIQMKGGTGTETICSDFIFHVVRLDTRVSNTLTVPLTG